MTDNGMIEALRNDSSSVMPEIFYQASKFLLFPLVFENHGPRLKDCWGDEKGAINTFRGDGLEKPPSL